MPITAYPGGVSSFGMIAGVGSAMDRYYGGGKAKVLWVGNRTGLPSGDGSSPEYPLASVFGTGGAIDKLNSETDRGHVIFAMPGHAESIAAARLTGTGTATTSGSNNAYALVGLGGRIKRPTFTFSATASKLTVDTTDIQFENLNFANGAADPTLGFSIAASGFAMRRCYIQSADGTNKFVTLMDVAATGDDCTIENVEIYGGAAESTDIITLAAADRFKLLNCDISAVVGVANGVLRATGAAVAARILGCNFSSRKAASTVAVKGHATWTGWIDDCRMEVAAGTVADVNLSAGPPNLPLATLAAAFNTPGTISIGKRNCVALATGKVGIDPALVLVTV